MALVQMLRILAAAMRYSPVHLGIITGVLVLLIVAPLAALGQTEDPSSGAGTSTPAQRDAVRLDPNLPTSALLQRARALAVLNDHAAAEMIYKGILIREPENVTAMLELADIYEAAGKLQYAMGLLTRASLAKPYDAAIIDRHRQIVTRLSQRLQAEVDSMLVQGAWELAVPKLASLLTAEPENPELYYLKAQCHLKLGRPDVAMVEIEKALDLHKSERYFELKEEAEATIRDTGISELVGKVEALLPAASPAGKEEALRYLARILELDPDHQWAGEQFGALTAYGEKDTGSRVTSGLAGFVSQAGRVLKRIGTGIVDALALLYKHLQILLMILFVILILNSPFTHVLVRGFSPRQSLTGQLKQFTIHEVLTLLNTHHSTGALRLKTPSLKGKIFFEDGEIYHCKCKGKTGRGALQSLLKNAGEGFFVFTEDAAAKYKTIDTPLSLILMELPERRSAVTSKSILQKQKRKSKMKSLLGAKK